MSRISRRRFIGQAAAAVAAPTIVPSSVFGRQDRPAPSERITMGFIGVGGMGQANLNSFINHKDVQVVAVCDVSSGGKNGGRSPVKERVEKHYAEKAKDGSYKGCETYKDFRELIARKDIDAVCVATPDHWHALASLEAMKAGKDVYCEKPVVHLFGEGLVIVEAQKKYKRVWQTGSQQRSERNFRHAAELVLNGHIGKVEKVHVTLPVGHDKPAGNPNQTEIPADLDYDFWCGPSKMLPYNGARLNFHWRWNLNYGGGQLMDWIGHHNDIAHWGLGEDRGGPIEVAAEGFTYPPADVMPLYDAPVRYTVKSKYAAGYEITITSDPALGTKWTGDKGWVFVTRGKIDASEKKWLEKDFDPGERKAYVSNDHRRNFLDCIKSRKETICPSEVSFCSAIPGLLGYVAQATGKKLKYDPKERKIVGDDAADKLLREVNYRAPWKLEL
jgi:predicted dehydrogenase